MVSSLPEHLVGQIEQFKVQFNTQSQTDTRKVVIEIRITSFEIDRYNITLVLDGLGDKILFPFPIGNDASFLFP